MPRGVSGWRFVLALAALALAVLALAVLASACSLMPTVPLDETLESPTGPTASPTTSDRPADDSSSAPDLSNLPGTLAIGGSGGLRFAAPDGSTVRTIDGEGLVITQPTWSRDGERSISLRVLSAENVETVVVDSDGAVKVHEARRPYFFFSWSGDGTLIAALGPGPQGTTLDILDRDGSPVASEGLDAGSFYLAWEPGGTGLLLHRDETLELAPDPTNLSTRVSLGAPGEWFLAPAWIPGTRDALIVEPGPAGNRLVRIAVDSGDRVDLGPVNKGIGVVASPNGDEAVLAHGAADEGGGAILVANPVAEPKVLAATEIVDVHTGHRRKVSDEFSLWAEWSPDGEALLLLQAAVDQTGAEWVVWRDGAERRLGGVTLSPVFFRNYVQFSWQFVESPRLWSPDGAAFVYAGAESKGAGVFVTDLASGSAVRVAEGDVGFWSPR